MIKHDSITFRISPNESFEFTRICRQGGFSKSKILRGLLDRFITQYTNIEDMYDGIQEPAGSLEA